MITDSLGNINNLSAVLQKYGALNQTSRESNERTSSTQADDKAFSFDPGSILSELMPENSIAANNHLASNLILTDFEYAQETFKFNYNFTQTSSDGDLVEIGNNAANGINSSTSLSIVVERVVEKIRAKFSVDDVNGKTGNNEISDLQDFWSPENTASRIFDFATGFFEAFRDRALSGDKDTPLLKILEDFTSLMKNSINNGFGQAQSVLDNLTNGLPKNIQGTVDMTYDRVFEKIEIWVQNKTDEIKELDQGTGNSEYTVEDSQGNAETEIDQAAA
jgi:hypothetical protein